MYRNPVIVHISDLHFGLGNHNEEASQALAAAIVDTFPLPDFVVATGDLTQWGTPEEVAQARQYLLSLLNELWRRHGHAARCIVVPGNHDLLLTAWKAVFWRKRLEDFNQVFDTWGFVGDAVPADEKKVVAPATLEEYYAGQGGQATAQSRAREALRVCEYYPRFQTAFVKINSNVARIWWPGDIATGCAGKEQLSNIESVLKNYAEAFPSTAEKSGFQEARLIAAVHHHVTQLRGAEYEEHMLMRDAGDVWQRLSQAGCELILHGHRHRAAQLKLSFWDPAGKEHGTTVLAAGAATARDTDDGWNSCHRIYLGHMHTAVCRPRFEEGHFTSPEASPTVTLARPFELALDPGLEGGPQLNLQALKDSLITEESIPDRHHGYDTITFTGVIDDERNYHGCYLLEGSNVSGQPSTHLHFSLTAVGSHRFEDFGLSATDLDRGQPLAGIEVTKDRPITAFPIRLPFLSPLDHGQRFRIRVCFRLPQVMLDQNDYDMVNLVRFRRGVRRIVHRLLSTRRISEPAYLAVRGQKVVDMKLHLEPFEDDFANLVPGGLGGRRVSGYQVAIDAPEAISYLFYYRRLL